MKHFELHTQSVSLPIILRHKTVHTLQSTAFVNSRTMLLYASGDNTVPFYQQIPSGGGDHARHSCKALTNPPSYFPAGTKASANNGGVSKRFSRTVANLSVPLTRFQMRYLRMCDRKKTSWESLGFLLRPMSLSFPRNEVNGMANREKTISVRSFTFDSISLSSLFHSTPLPPSMVFFFRCSLMGRSSA